MYCRECGKELNPTDKFCPNCGTKVTADPMENAEAMSIGFSSLEDKDPEDQSEELSYGRQTFDFKWNTIDFEHEKSPETETEAFDWGDLLGIREREEKKNDLLTRKTINITQEREAIERARLEEEAKREAARAAAEARASQVVKVDPVAEPVSEPVAGELTMEEEPSDTTGADDDEPEGSGFEPQVEKDFLSVEKFYTFQKKNAEFEELLNMEYDRLKKAGGSSKEIVDELAGSSEEVDPKEAESAAQFVDKLEKTMGLEKSQIEAALEEAHDQTTFAKDVAEEPPVEVASEPVSEHTPEPAKTEEHTLGQESDAIEQSVGSIEPADFPAETATQVEAREPAIEVTQEPEVVPERELRKSGAEAETDVAKVEEEPIPEEQVAEEQAPEPKGEEPDLPVEVPVQTKPSEAEATEPTIKSEEDDVKASTSEDTVEVPKEDIHAKAEELAMQQTVKSEAEEQDDSNVEAEKTDDGLSEEVSAVVEELEALETDNPFKPGSEAAATWKEVKSADDQLEEMAKARDMFFSDADTQADKSNVATEDDGETDETRRISKAEIAAFVKLAEEELGITEEDKPVEMPQEPDAEKPLEEGQETPDYGEQISIDLAAGDKKSDAERSKNDEDIVEIGKAPSAATEPERAAAAEADTIVEKGSADIKEASIDPDFDFGYEDDEEIEMPAERRGKVGTIVIIVLAILMILEIACFVIRYNFPDSGLAQTINPFFEFIDEKVRGLFGG